MNSTAIENRKNWAKAHATAVVLHCFYPAHFAEISGYLNNLEGDFDLYVSLPEEQAAFADHVLEIYPQAHIVLFENRGRDIASFLSIFKEIYPLGYEFILKIHTKGSPHRQDGADWRKDVLDKLMGSSAQIRSIQQLIGRNPQVGIIGAQGHILNARFYMGDNYPQVQELFSRAGFPGLAPRDFNFVASTMFWIKPDTFSRLAETDFPFSEFPEEPIPIDGTLAHAWERFFGLLAESEGFRIEAVDLNGAITQSDPYFIYPYASPSRQLLLRNLRKLVFYKTYPEAFAIEYLCITAPFRQMGVEIISGEVEGVADPDRVLMGDAVIFQREFPGNTALYDQILTKARENEKPVIYELDDLLFDLPENHPEREAKIYTQALQPMLAALIEADLVIVPTEKLKEVLAGYNENILVLPNYLDDRLWQFRSPQKPQSREEVVTIGYMGSDSHTPDLEIIAPVMQELNRRYGNSLQMVVWGTPLPETLKGLGNVEWIPIKINLYVNFADYFQKQSADIMIAPLVANLFNACKSPIKFFEYSALGCPGVYSRVGPYPSVIKQGVNGFLAETPEEWLDLLSKLIEDEGLRQTMATNAQETVRAHWLLSRQKKSWSMIYDQSSGSFSSESTSKVLKAHIANTIRRQQYQAQLDSHSKLADLQNESLHLQNQMADLRSQSENESLRLQNQMADLRSQFENESLRLQNQMTDLRSQLAQTTEYNRTLMVQNDSLDEQLRYWSDQAKKNSQELNVEKSTLDEIYGSKAWRVITRYRTWRTSLVGFGQKIRNAARSVTRLTRKVISPADVALISSSPLFDREYYLAQNADVKNAGVDPVRHYLRHGGFEGRDPSLAFNSKNYLARYPDVKAEGINPLLHYLKFGQNEGREAQSANPSEPSAISGGSAITFGSPRSMIPDSIWQAPQLAEFLRIAMRDQYVLSLSHDDYLTETGGVQIIITDEQNAINRSNWSFLHIYPYHKGKSLLSEDTFIYIGVNLDGHHVCETEVGELVAALRQLGSKKLVNIQMHHVMGFSVPALQSILELSNGKAGFWLHDYFSLCPSYNLLLNDKFYCGAPKIESNSCSICSYGVARHEHLQLIAQLFRENQLEVIAPSEFTLDLWQQKFPMQDLPGEVISPARLTWQPALPLHSMEGPLRVAFLGYPLEHKGWKTWLAMTEAIQDGKSYKFYHFSSRSAVKGNFQHVDTRVTKEHRLAMVENLRLQQIDAAVLWSQVAETFSFTLYEALSAGCYILTNPQSGNIQDTIRKNPERGMILETEKDLIEFLKSGELVERVKDYQRNGKPQAILTFNGELVEL